MTTIARSRIHGLLAAVVLIAMAPTPTGAAVSYNVSFVDPGGAYSAFYSQIESHTLAAGDAWAGHLNSNASLEVVIKFDSAIPRATGSSVTSSFVLNNGTYNVFEEGAGAEVRSGLDPNGSQPDVQFVFNPTYLANELWFDPNPVARIDPVPASRTDAMTVFLHEFGHAFAFNGWRNAFDGSLPGNYESRFDALTTFDGANFFFHGSDTAARYGGAVPLTFGNITHFGNNLPRPGSDLIGDLMNGVVFYRGDRYDISPLDLALLRDVGLPVTQPVLGDFDRDNVRTAGDIAAMLQALTDLGAYRSAESLTLEDLLALGDIDGNGQIANADVQALIDLLIDGGRGTLQMPAVPEPSSLVLLGLGSLYLLGPLQKRQSNSPY